MLLYIKKSSFIDWTKV